MICTHTYTYIHIYIYFPFFHAVRSSSSLPFYRFYFFNHYKFMLNNILSIQLSQLLCVLQFNLVSFARCFLLPFKFPREWITHCNVAWTQLENIMKLNQKNSNEIEMSNFIAKLFTMVNVWTIWLNIYIYLYIYLYTPYFIYNVNYYGNDHPSPFLGRHLIDKYDWNLQQCICFWLCKWVSYCMQPFKISAHVIWNIAKLPVYFIGFMSNMVSLSYQ